MMGLGWARCRKPRPKPTSAAIRIRACQLRRWFVLLELLLGEKSVSLKLPLCIYSKTTHFSSEQKPSTATMWGCRMWLRSFTCNKVSDEERDKRRNCILVVCKLKYVKLGILKYVN